LLIERIIEAQLKRGWSDGEFSKRMGIAKSVWSRVKNKKRGVTVAIMRAAYKALPEVLVYLIDDITKEET